MLAVNVAIGVVLSLLVYGHMYRGGDVLQHGNTAMTTHWSHATVSWVRTPGLSSRTHCGDGQRPREPLAREKYAPVDDIPSCRWSTVRKRRWVPDDFAQSSSCTGFGVTSLQQKRNGDVVKSLTTLWLVRAANKPYQFHLPEA